MPDRPSQSKQPSDSAIGSAGKPGDSAAAGRGAAPDVGALAADLAIAQENEGLRLALREQERIVEELTNECRRLEDRLEDRYQDIDALRRELDRGEKASRMAGDQPARLAGDEETTLLVPGEPNGETSENAPTRSAPTVAKAGGLSGFGGGLLAGVVLSGATVLGLWGAGMVALAPAAPVANNTLTPKPLPTKTVTTIPTAAPSTEPRSSAQPIAGAGKPPMPSQAETESFDTPNNSVESGSAEAPAEPLRIPEAPVAGLRSDPLGGGDGAGPEMAILRASEFMMGNPIGMADSDARPAHKVSLNDFMISSHEITFSDYDRFVRETGARRPSDFGWGRGSRPVVDVSWDEAVAYTQWLSRKTGKDYRLPSEAEWEYAARGGTTTSYWWGIGSPASRALCMNCGTRWDQVSTAPVGSFPANPFGLFDTAGNVYEWTADCYHHSYNGAPVDGSARIEPECNTRAVRGGSFNSPASAMRSHARNRFIHSSHADMIGFRVARDIVPNEIEQANADSGVTQQESPH